MRYIIHIQNEEGYLIAEEKLCEAAARTLEHHDLSAGCELTIVITGDETVAALNRQFRGVDLVTDVLSFPALKDKTVAKVRPVYLGDLVIAYPYAAQQAERENLPFEDSMVLLVIHGTLHLLGYDHDTIVNREKMWAVQAQILIDCAVATDIVPVLEGEFD